MMGYGGEKGERSEGFSMLRPNMNEREGISVRERGKVEKNRELIAAFWVKPHKQTKNNVICGVYANRCKITPTRYHFFVVLFNFGPPVEHPFLLDY